MNTLLLSIILIPIIEIYLFIKIGSQIGAFKTIFLIFFTAVVGVYYAKHEGLNTIKSGLTNMIRNQIPAYELISSAAIALAAILLIMPGFATDVLGFLLIFPLTRKLLFTRLGKNYESKKSEKKNFIEGEFEDIEDDHDRKI